MAWCEEVTGHHGACLFQDIVDLIPNGTIEPDWTYSEKLKATLGATTAERGACVAHDSHCLVNKLAVFDVRVTVPRYVKSWETQKAGRGYKQCVLSPWALCDPEPHADSTD